MPFARRPQKEILSSLADVTYRLFWPHPSRMDLPPEPLCPAFIQMTRWSLDQADRHQGNRSLWPMDRLDWELIPKPDSVSHLKTAWCLVMEVHY